MVHSAPKQQDIQALKEMGFEEKVIIEALKACDNNRERATEWILSRGSDSNSSIIPFGPVQDPRIPNEDDELTRAIAMSIEENRPASIPPEKRDLSVPLGLKNIGNIPYFTSIVQLLHAVPEFRAKISDAVIQVNQDDPYKRKLSKFLQELKNTFRLMDSSEKKFEDSNSVFAAYTEIEGAYQIDNQKNDVADYLLKVVARTEEGLKYNHQGNDAVPNRKDSLNFLVENPLVYDLFHGKTVNVVKYSNGGPKPVKKMSGETVFGKFELDAEHMELYEAWNKTMSKRLENYPVDDGSVTAKQVTWVNTLPKLLVFDIKRQQLDAHGHSVKNKKAFAFPEKLHPGRFLYENHGESYKLQKSLRSNKRKVKNLKSSVEKFENFNGTDLNIAKMLGLCSEFLKHQANNSDMLEGNDFEPLVVEGLEPGAITRAFDLIHGYSAVVDEKLAKMKTDLESYSSNIEMAFNTEKFNQHEYELTAVIVHDGDIGSSQFYSYMHLAGKWMKFQDISVSEVNFKEVMFHSLGEYGISAACCLVYSKVK